MLSALKNLFKPQHKVTDFSDIGFIVNSMDDMMKFGNQAFKNGKRIEVPGKGAYYYWGLHSGAELWAQLDIDDQLIGLHPGFSGMSKVPLKAKPYFSTRDTPLDGSYSCWLITDDQEYQLEFEAPNFYQNSENDKELNITAQITAFAKQEINYFTNEDERGKHGLWSQWAVQSFVPSGSFNSDLDADLLPYALLSGYVKEVELRKNEITGAEFYWLFVDSLSASYDVVVDAQLLSTEPRVGGIISGNFYLSGKILE